jgi:hypothetical protein
MATTPRKGHPTRRAVSVNQPIPDAESREPAHTGFDPDEALGRLWYQFARVEALAQAACQALEFLPGGQDQESRRGTERLHALVTATAEAAMTALDAVDEQMSRLSAARAEGMEDDPSEPPST